MTLVTASVMLGSLRPAAQAQLTPGTILVIDQQGGTGNLGALFRVDPVTGARTLLSDFGNSVQGPLGRLPFAVALEAAGTILVSNRDAGSGSQGALFRVHPGTGVRTLLSDFGVGAPDLLGLDPLGVALEASGTILVSNTQAGTDERGVLFRVDPVTGVRTRLSDFDCSAGCSTPQGPLGRDPTGVALEAAGTILVTDFTAGTSTRGALFRVHPATGVRTLLSDFGVGAPDLLGLDPIGVAVVPEPLNQPPSAAAGDDQTVARGTFVTLDGSDSVDPDGHTPLQFAWTFAQKPAGSVATLTAADTSTPSFTADSARNYTLRLVVTDTQGATSAPDEVVVSTVNSKPVAEAGLDQAVRVRGTTIHLDGHESYDPDGDPLTFAWTLLQTPAMSTATLSNATSSTPTFVADVPGGDYRIQLLVTDNFGAVSEPDTVLVSFANLPPVADAGDTQTVLVGATVVLDGRGSFDENGDPLTFRWSLTIQPDASQATLSNSSAPGPGLHGGSARLLHRQPHGA
jgi:K319-like protein